MSTNSVSRTDAGVMYIKSIGAAVGLVAGGATFFGLGLSSWGPEHPGKVWVFTAIAFATPIISLPILYKVASYCRNHFQEHSPSEEEGIPLASLITPGSTDPANPTRVIKV